QVVDMVSEINLAQRELKKEIQRDLQKIIDDNWKLEQDYQYQFDGVQDELDKIQDKSDQIESDLDYKTSSLDVFLRQKFQDEYLNLVSAIQKSQDYQILDVSDVRQKMGLSP